MLEAEVGSVLLEGKGVRRCALLVLVLSPGTQSGTACEILLFLGIQNPAHDVNGVIKLLLCVGNFAGKGIGVGNVVAAGYSHRDIVAIELIGPEIDVPRLMGSLVRLVDAARNQVEPSWRL